MKDKSKIPTLFRELDLNFRNITAIPVIALVYYYIAVQARELAGGDVPENPVMASVTLLLASLHNHSLTRNVLMDKIFTVIALTATTLALFFLGAAFPFAMAEGKPVVLAIMALSLGMTVWNLVLAVNERRNPSVPKQPKEENHATEPGSVSPSS